MSKMSELHIDIQVMLNQGYRPATISSMLDIPESWIDDTDTQDEELEINELENS